MVIGEEKKLIRDTTRLVSLYKLLSENFIDGRRFISKIGEFKLDEPYSVIPANGSIELTFCVTVDANVSAGTIISNQGTVNYDSNSDESNDALKPTDDPATTLPDDSTVLTIASPAPPQVQAPALTPVGVLALLGMLSIVLALSVKKRRKGE